MNFLKRCWQNKWIRSLAWTAVTLVTLYVLLCTWLNWSWGRQWNATAAMLKAEGESLDFRADAAGVGVGRLFVEEHRHGTQVVAV